MLFTQSAPLYAASSIIRRFYTFHSQLFDHKTTMSTDFSIEHPSDAELRWKLAQFGYQAGPVTTTTRKVLADKLEKLTTAEAGEKLAGSNTNDDASVVASRELQDDVKHATGIRPAKLALLFFDVETSGLETDCDILQIAVRSGSSSFDHFVDPLKQIPLEVSRINHFYNRDGLLYRRDEKMDSRPMRQVLRDLLRYLSSMGDKCVLVAHNCSFDSQRLVYHIKQHIMEKEFSAVIDGFTDTLEMFREKYPERRWKKGSLTLKKLVEESFAGSCEGAHDATWDTEMLEKLAHLHFTVPQLLEKKRSFASVLQSVRRQQCGRKNKTIQTA